MKTDGTTGRAGTSLVQKRKRKVGLPGVEVLGEEAAEIADFISITMRSLHGLTLQLCDHPHQPISSALKVTHVHWQDRRQRGLETKRAPCSSVWLHRDVPACVLNGGGKTADHP